MKDRTKTLRPKLRIIHELTQLEANAILDLITPTTRTFLCRRTGHLVDGGYCAFFCPLGKERVEFDPGIGIDVTCPYAYNEMLGGMGDSAMSDA